MNSSITTQRIHFTLQFASAMCFIGHGAFGIITKKIWLNYFAVFGIGPATGYHLMPWLGIADVLLGISLLVYPTRAVLLWLVIWGAVTALLRPLSGEPFAEAIERAGNYGAPLALLFISGLPGVNGRKWFAAVRPGTPAGGQDLAGVMAILKVAVFLILAGHGWLNLIGKKALLSQYAAIGFANPAGAARLAGIFEISAAAITLVRPLRGLLLVLLVWKMGTELYYPHWEAFEWIERGGSYGCILALLLALPASAVQSRKSWLAMGIAPALLLVTFAALFFKSTRADASTPALPALDPAAMRRVHTLDSENSNATFVFVNPVPGASGLHNRVVMLPPVSDDLRINFDQYLHKGHNGALYIILPDSYAGPKEKFIMKAFSDYKGWYGSMLSDKFVMYAAK